MTLLGEVTGACYRRAVRGRRLIGLAIALGAAGSLPTAAVSSAVPADQFGVHPTWSTGASTDAFTVSATSSIATTRQGTLPATGGTAGPTLTIALVLLAVGVACASWAHRGRL